MSIDVSNCTINYIILFDVYGTSFMNYLIIFHLHGKGLLINLNMLKSFDRSNGYYLNNI